MGWDGMGWNGMEWNGTEWNRMEWNGEWNACDRTSSTATTRATRPRPTTTTTRDGYSLLSWYPGARSVTRETGLHRCALPLYDGRVLADDRYFLVVRRPNLTCHVIARRALPPDGRARRWSLLLSGEGVRTLRATSSLGALYRQTVVLARAMAARLAALFGAEARNFAGVVRALEAADGLENGGGGGGGAALAHVARPRSSRRSGASTPRPRRRRRRRMARTRTRRAATTGRRNGIRRRGRRRRS